MATYKTGKGTGTRTVEARQLVSAQDYDLAYWAGGTLHLDGRRDPEIRIQRETGTEYVSRYDWIVKDKKGNVKVVAPYTFNTTYRKVEEEKEESK